MNTDLRMNVNAETIKNLRKQKLWSQEELALACGVSLRTIQRAEGDGHASPDTIKALASVFEVDPQELVHKTAPVQNYFNIQLGYSVICLALPLVLIGALAFTEDYLNKTGFLVLMLVCTLVLSVFPSLTTQVEGGFVKWHFGLGLIKKAIPVSRIIMNKPVKNKAWWGIGIRLTPNGWLYNVSGLNAVMLVLDDGTQVRIGSDEPDEFSQAISEARGASHASS